MNEQQNTEIVQQATAAFLRGDIGYILGLLTQDVEWVFAGPERIPNTGTFRGPEQVARFFAIVGESFAFERYEPREYIAQGDKVVVLGSDRWRAVPTGKMGGGEWAAVFTFRDGKVAGWRYYYDTAMGEAAFTPSG